MPRIRGEGNSGGCRTCRRRKVKCDERHPACARCENANRECEGYGRDHRFVDENSRIENRVKRKAISEISNDPSTPLSTDSGQLFNPLNSYPSPSKDLGLSAFEENIQLSFLLTNLFADAGRIYPWLRLHAEDPSPCAVVSIRALGAAYFGRVHRIQKTTIRSFEYYIDALRKLNDNLQQPEDASSMTVFRSAIVLELYEFIAFNSTTGWLRHAGGVGKLIELRGPWRYQEEDERHLLESNRVTIALECLVKKKRCFLEHSDWKTIPWAADPASKTLTYYLYDILCDMPGLLEDATNIELSSLGMEQKQSLHRNYRAKSLFFCRLCMIGEPCGNSKITIPAGKCRHRAPTMKPFLPPSSAIQFYPPPHEICFYNAILLLILRLGSQVIGPVFDPTLPSLHLADYLNYNPLTPPGSAVDLQAVATEICKSVEFHLSHPASSAAAFMLLFPLKLAYQTFDPESKEAEWLRGVMRKIADMSGFEISRSLGEQKY